MTAFFVTSTGTGVGKTFLTAALVEYFRGLGKTVEAYKPVISGFDAAAAEESDTGVLLSALGRRVTSEEIARISPWRFAAPLSPHMAARREGRTIDFSALITYSKSKSSSADVVLVEGVGGIMVPLDNHHTVLDWMKQIGLPALLVVGSYLGTISHTLSALDVLGRYQIDVRAVVVNETPGSSVELQDTVAAIQEFAPRIAVNALPRVKNISEAQSFLPEVVAVL